jgi:hypothetical protein
MIGMFGSFNRLHSRLVRSSRLPTKVMQLVTSNSFAHIVFFVHSYSVFGRTSLQISIHNVMIFLFSWVLFHQYQHCYILNRAGTVEKYTSS